MGISAGGVARRGEDSELPESSAISDWQSSDCRSEALVSTGAITNTTTTATTASSAATNTTTTNTIAATSTTVE